MRRFIADIRAELKELDAASFTLGIWIGAAGMMIGFVIVILVWS